MNQRFVVLLRGHDPDGSVKDLPLLVPEAKIISREGEKLIVECPIYCEEQVIGYFSDDDHVISRCRIYSLQDQK